VGLANLGSESETCVGSRVYLVGVSISFEKNFYRLPFTPPLSGSPYRSFSLSGGEVVLNLHNTRQGTREGTLWFHLGKEKAGSCAGRRRTTTRRGSARQTRSRGSTTTRLGCLCRRGCASTRVRVGAHERRYVHVSFLCQDLAARQRGSVTQLRIGERRRLDRGSEPGITLEKRWRDEARSDHNVLVSG
jgi:hypothetical protein